MNTKQKLVEKMNRMVRNDVLSKNELIDVFEMFVQEKNKFSKNKHQRFLNLKYFSPEICGKILEILDKKEKQYEKKHFSSLISDLKNIPEKKTIADNKNDAKEELNLLNLLDGKNETTKKRKIDKIENTHEIMDPNPQPHTKKKCNDKQISQDVSDFFTFVASGKNDIKKIFESKKKPLSHYKGIYQRIIKSSNKLVQKPINNQFKEISSILLGPSYDDEEQVLEYLEPEDMMQTINQQIITIVDDDLPEDVIFSDNDNDNDDDDEDEPAKDENEEDDDEQGQNEEDDDFNISDEFGEEDSGEEDEFSGNAKERLKRLSERYL